MYPTREKWPRIKRWRVDGDNRILPTLDVIVVTLAVGPKYVDLAVNLLRVLDQSGIATLVVTDDPRPFPERTIVIPYAPDGTHIWHAKRHAVRAGLERAQTAYFVDADYQPIEGTAEAVVLPPLPPGATSLWPGQSLGTIRFRNVGSLVDVQILSCPGTLDGLQAALHTPPWREILWWGDELYAVSRDEGGAWLRFLEAWDEFARHQPADVKDARRMFVAGDGVAMAFAAAAAGWTPREDYNAFVPIKRAFRHVRVGTHYKLALEQAVLRPVE